MANLLVRKTTSIYTYIALKGGVLWLKDVMQQVIF